MIVLSLWHGEQNAPEPRQLPSEIIADVAARHGLTREDLTGPNRSQRIAHPRQEAMWELHTRTTLSSANIGRRLGGRDHSTVLHGIARHEGRLGLAAPTRPIRVAAKAAPKAAPEPRREGIVFKSFEGSQDGIRFGRARWPDGYATSFFYDRINDTVRLVAHGEDNATDVTRARAGRIELLRAAILERLSAPPALEGDE